MTDITPFAKKNKLREAFDESIQYFREDKKRLVQPATIVTGILLGSTSLATPLLGGMVGAGLAMAAGMYLLMKTSDVVVNNANALGKKAGIAPMALGIGLGVLTSMPELFVSAGAMFAGNPGVGIGNVVGSNIANLALILGGTALIKDIKSTGMSWKFNAAVMCGATALFGAQMAMGALSPVIGGVMLGGLGLYLWQSYKIAQKDASDEEKKSGKAADAGVDEVGEQKLPLGSNVGLGLAGVAGLIGSAGFLVASATAFGLAAGVSPVVIGVLAVAIGTSLPEVMVNVKSALKGNTDMAVGNILGSNVFNLLMIGGILSLTGAPMPADLNPTASPLGFLNTLALGATAFGTWALMKATGGSIGKKAGLAAVGVYAAYSALTVALGGAPDPVAQTQQPPAIEQRIEQQAPQKAVEVPVQNQLVAPKPR